MPIRLRLPHVLVLLVPLAGITACGDNSAPTIGIAVVGDPGDPFTQGIRLSPAGQLARAATAEGLVGFDEEGRVVPAMADRWIVTDDGLSYIFRLRDGSWSDGTALTGETGRDALRKAITELHGTSLGQDLAAVAEVRAMAGRVVEIRLKHPMPNLLDLLAQPELALLRKDKGTGPLEAKRDGTADLLRPVPPEKLGLAQTHDWADNTHSIRLVAESAASAVNQFEGGSVQAVLGGTAADYGLALSASGLSRSALRIDPVTGLFGLVATSTAGPLADPKTREALAMAIDRDAIAADLGIREWVPTSRVIPALAIDAPETIGERWSSLDMPHRRAEAQSRLLPGKGQAVALRIALPSGPGADVIFTHIKSDFAAVGITAQRVGMTAPADLRLLDSVARYALVDWYFNQFACAAGHNPCSDMADSKAEQAEAESDPVKRSSLLEDAEAALTLSNIFIPLGTPVRWSLVRGQLSGFAPNARSWHPLGPVAIRQK